MSWHTSIPYDAMLDSWIKNNFNVLFHGRHGVGKTSMIFNAFHRNGWKLGVDYLYFSAATIDPWVDLIGVPSKVQNEAGEEVLKLIRPATINSRTIKAFFLDELNRSHKKVRNAVMELIQFKSINGLKFENLEIIWAAVNPDEDNDLKYDVEKLDPAQADRFHIHVSIPYKPDESYFAKKYNPEMASAVCRWWDNQPEKVKQEVSPRRLEYAIEVFLKTNDIRYVVPIEAHVPSLKSAISLSNPEKTFKELLNKGDENEIRKWLAVDNNINSVQNLICTDKKICEKSLHLLSEERIIAFASKNSVVLNQFKSNPKKFEKIIRNLAENSSQKMIKQICTKLIPYIESTNKLGNIDNIPCKNNGGISARRMSQLSKNYKLVLDAGDVLHVNNNSTSISEDLLNIVTECSFADSPLQRNKIIESLGDIVHPNMSKEETNACLKISEFFSSYIGNPSECEKYIPVLNCCVISFINLEDNQTIQSLIKIAPNLVNNILSKIADQKFKENANESPIEGGSVLLKVDNSQYLEIEESIESAKQAVEELF